MTTVDLLPSWRPGTARDDLVTFLDAVLEVHPEDRVACFDNDGTLWCERPSYVQLDFFVDALRARVAEEPEVARVPELAALLAHDEQALAEVGLERVALALTSLFAGTSPEDFVARVREFMSRAEHPTLGRPLRTVVYQPMLELVAALRARDVTVTIVTGGGTEFVRAISQQLYGVPPQSVVGTLIDYDYGRDHLGVPRLRRSSRIVGGANEGATKVSNIQSQLGRRPLLAAGNSGGDREMLEWAAAAPGPALALLVDHDDAERELAYMSSAETVAEPEPITDVAARLGWTVASIATDWETVFV